MARVRALVIAKTICQACQETPGVQLRLRLLVPLGCVAADGERC